MSLLDDSSLDTPKPCVTPAPHDGAIKPKNNVARSSLVRLPPQMPCEKEKKSSGKVPRGNQLAALSTGVCSRLKSSPCHSELKSRDNVPSLCIQSPDQKLVEPVCVGV